MKKQIFLILLGIGIALLVVGIVFVVPWFGKMLDEMEQMAERHMQHKQALRTFARQPLVEEQETLLSRLIDINAETHASQNPNDLEEVLSSEPYLTYLNGREGENYADFQAYLEAMPTENMKTVALSRITAVLATDKGDEEIATDKSDEEIAVWTNYYFIVREWGITIEDPLDNMKELQGIQQTHLIEPLMKSDSGIDGLNTKIAQISMSSRFMTEDNDIFKEVWRERLERRGLQEGLLRCAIATPGEFALMRSFFADMAAFQEWILKRPEPEEPAPEQ